MRSGAVHAVVDPLRLAVKLAFDLKRGIAVGDNAHVPSGAVVSVAIGFGTIREDLRRRLALITGAKRAGTTLDAHGLADEIMRPAGALRGNNHPTSGDG